nr:hypothetical protein [Tanacetum cinerariifolium]
LLPGLHYVWTQTPRRVSSSYWYLLQVWSNWPQKDCKKNTTANTSGQADKKPGASGRVFAITEDHATKTSEHHAMIDCRSYRVIFGDIQAPEFIYHGSLPRKSM